MVSVDIISVQTILRYTLTWRTLEAGASRPGKSVGARRVTRRHGIICVTMPNVRREALRNRLSPASLESSAPKPANFGRTSTAASFPSARIASTWGTVHETNMRSI